MAQPHSHSPAAHLVRRATLIDVPAVARLLDLPHSTQWRGGTVPSAHLLTSGTRLVLTHVALDLGQFWVATDAVGDVRAAVVLLPPGGKSDQVLDVALRLELGLLPSDRPTPVGLADFLEEHWLLLPAAALGDESLLRDLLEAAMPPIDADGRGVVSLHSGPPPQALLDVGFQLLPSPVTGGSAALRPSLPSPVAV